MAGQPASCEAGKELASFSNIVWPGSQHRHFSKLFEVYFNEKPKSCSLFDPPPLPARLGAQNRYLKKIINWNYWLSDPWPLQTRPGTQNQCFFLEFSLKAVDFSIPGRSRPDPVLKIDTFQNDFNWTSLTFHPRPLMIRRAARARARVRTCARSI